MEPGRLRREDCLLVADDSADGVVGLVLGRACENEPGYAGEIRVLHISPAHQRQGIGRQLVCAVVDHFAQHAIDSMVVHVLKANPNRPFYERLGGQFVREEPYDWNGVILPDVIYGWRNIAPITTRR